MKLSVKIAGVLTVAAAAMTAKNVCNSKRQSFEDTYVSFIKDEGQAASDNLFYFRHSQTSHRSRPFRKSAKPCPHLVIIGGDLAEGGVPSARIEENIKRLVHFGVPIVFVWGIMIMKSGSISCIPYLKRTASSL